MLCPMCNREIKGNRVALSRVDNETSICNDCGTVESLIDYVCSNIDDRVSKYISGKEIIIKALEGGYKIICEGVFLGYNY